MANDAQQSPAAEIIAELESYLQQELGTQELDREEDLLDQGLDSMMLIETQSRLYAQGAEVEFGELAEEPTVSAWTKLIERAVN